MKKVNRISIFIIVAWSLGNVNQVFGQTIKYFDFNKNYSWGILLGKCPGEINTWDKFMIYSGTRINNQRDFPSNQLRFSLENLGASHIQYSFSKTKENQGLIASIFSKCDFLDTNYGSDVVAIKRLAIINNSLPKNQLQDFFQKQAPHFKEFSINQSFSEDFEKRFLSYLKSEELESGEILKWINFRNYEVQ